MTGFDIPSDVTFADDLDVSTSPDTYVDPQAPLPINDGRYGFRIEKMSLRTVSKEDKTLRLDDGKFPVVTLEQLEIVEPAELAGRKVMLYQDFRTKPFPRRGADGVERQANNVADALRSNDVNVSFNGVTEGLRLLEATAGQGGVFYGRFRWTATDIDAAKEQVNAIKTAAGVPLTATNAQIADKTVRDAINAVWKKFKLQGQKKFRTPAGTYGPLMSQGGEPIEPRTEIAEFIPSNKVGTVKLGSSV